MDVASTAADSTTRIPGWAAVSRASCDRSAARSLSRSSGVEAIAMLRRPSAVRCSIEVVVRGCTRGCRTSRGRVAGGSPLPRRWRGSPPQTRAGVAPSTSHRVEPADIAWSSAVRSFWRGRTRWPARQCRSSWRSRRPGSRCLACEPSSSANRSARPIVDPPRLGSTNGAIRSGVQLDRGDDHGHRVVAGILFGGAELMRDVKSIPTARLSSGL